MPTDEEIQAIFGKAVSAHSYMKEQKAPFKEKLEAKPFWQVPVTEGVESSITAGKTVLGRIIDVLSRGEYASANLAKDYILGKPFDYKEAVKGLTGERKTTYDALVPEVFPHWGKWKQRAMGFALSIFADPTTYIPAGAVTKPLQLAGKTKTMAKILAKADESTFVKLFKPGAGLPKPYYESKYYAQKAIEAQHERIIKDIAHLRSGLSKEDMTRLSFLREHPEEWGNVPAPLMDKLEQVGARLDALVDDALENKIITPDVAQKWREKSIPYMPHHYPERGISTVRGSLPPSLFEKVKKPTYLKQRTFETLEDAKRLSSEFADIAESKTLDEARQKIATYKLEGAFGKGQVTNFEDLKSYAGVQSKYYKPEENALKLLAVRQIEQANHIAREKFVGGVLEEFGTKVKAGTKVVPEGMGVYLPKGGLRFFGKEYLEPGFIKNLKGIADRLKELRIRIEKIQTVKKTTETTITGGAKLAETGPMARMEGVVRDALTNRGMTTGEADVYISKLKANGSEAVDDIIKEISEKTEITKTSLGSEGAEELIDISKLSEIQKKKLVGVTSKVPTYMLPQSIATDMNNGLKLFSQDPAVGKFWNLFDKGQNVWKGFATVYRLPFHLRNMYSNWWQAWLAGVKNPERFTQALAVQTGAVKEVKLGKQTFSYDEIKKLVEDFGIHGKGWAGADIPTKLYDELDSIVKYGKLRHLKKPSSLPRAFGTLIEDNARIAVFLDQIAKGKTPREASQTVRKYLFDYTELTEFEKKVARRAMPFYTWFRKNSVLQIESLVSQPRKFQAYGKGLRALEEPETKTEQRLKPEYFNELMYVKSPFKSEKGRPLYMSIDLPPLEFNRLFSAKQWLSSLTPYKAAFEIGLNFKTFPYPSKIQEQPLEKTIAPMWVTWLPSELQNFLKKNQVIDKIIDKRTGKIILGMDKRWVHGFHSAFPFLNEISRIYAQPISLEDENPKLKWKTYRTGIGLKTLDKTRQSISEAYRQLEFADRIQRFALQHGRAPNKKEMEILKPKE